MGRKSKLTPDQWEEVAVRLSHGEAERTVAAAYGVSATALRLHFEKVGRLPTVNKVASMIVETEAALMQLPISAQITAQNLAARLKAISSSLAQAAELGAATSHRLSALANSQVAKVDDAEPLQSIDKLRDVGVLTKLANESASIALNLLASNKESVKQLNDEDGAQQAKEAAQNRPQISREQWLAEHGLT